MPDTETRNGNAIAFLRVCVGVLFLIFGEYKVIGRDFTRGGGFQYWINRFLQEGAYPFMVPVLKGFVLPHATAIAFLVAYGELAIGISLVIGVWSRLASIFGFIYMLGLLFSSDTQALTSRSGSTSELLSITPYWRSASLRFWWVSPSYVYP
jgi:uncharacterized membrane protein YphA (DoxX/SURF4 family)